MFYFKQWNLGKSVTQLELTNPMGRLFNIMDIQYYRFELGETFYTQKTE